MATDGSPIVVNSGGAMINIPQQTVPISPRPPGHDTKVLDKRRLQELVKEVDPLEQLDEDVEDVSYSVLVVILSIKQCNQYLGQRLLNAKLSTIGFNLS